MALLLKLSDSPPYKIAKKIVKPQLFCTAELLTIIILREKLSDCENTTFFRYLAVDNFNFTRKLWQGNKHQVKVFFFEHDPFLFCRY